MRILLAIAICISPGAWPEFASAQQQNEEAKIKVLPEDLNNRTVRFDSAETGLGVQYFGSDDRTFLWFPGQIRIASGTWSDQSFHIEPNSSNTDAAPKIITFRQICFKFSSTPRASLLTRSFGSTERFSIQKIDAIVQEVADGDLLNLASGKVPCRICLDDLSLSQLKEKFVD